MTRHTHVVVLGGGFAGAYCARRLIQQGGPQTSVTVIDRNNYLLFYPLLVEAGTGSLEPRHATVPLRRMLKEGCFRMGDVLDVDTTACRVTYRLAGEGPTMTLSYDHLVVALGSVTNLPPLPGLAEFGFKMKSLADAVSLRDRVFQLLERADATPDPEERRQLLHVVVVGGSFTGVEVAGEYAALMRRAVRLYPRIDPRDIRFTLIEMSNRILTALSPEMSEHAARAMHHRGVDIVLNSSIKEIGPDFANLANGERLSTQTVIWCAGIAAHPLIKRLRVTTDKKGWILTERDGRIQGLANVWGVGDCAVNLDSAGKAYPPTAQSAVGEGTFVADNILRQARGEPTLPIKFRIKGMVTPLGGHNAVVNFGQHYFTGFFAWVVYRLFYLFRIPGFARKLRVALDWLGSTFTEGDAVGLNLQPRRPAPLPERRGYNEILVGAGGNGNGNGHALKHPS
jgi:NADH dehydrogenase